MQQNRRVTSNPFQAFVERRLQSAFLKSGSTTEYYEILEVRVGAATLQEIKKSYRAKALKLHPDKIKQRHGRPPSDEEKAELSQIKEAYNVLIDPERRKTYDCLGERGLQVLENPSTAGTPQEIFLFAIGNFKRNNADKAWLTTILFLWVCLLITAPILVCLKADGGLQDMSWTATWFPFWIFDVFYLMDALYVNYARLSCMFRGLFLCYVVIIFHIQWYTRKPCSSFIIPHKNTINAQHHHTNNNP